MWSSVTFDKLGLRLLVGRTQKVACVTDLKRGQIIGAMSRCSCHNSLQWLPKDDDKLPIEVLEVAATMI